jgi:hypothetical protein
MNSLDRTHRRTLETVVRKARRSAEAGARQALDHLAVGHHEPRGHLTPGQRSLRNRLRARARQLGDKRDARGVQEIERLVEQCAYEHWHRMLFARFLAENGLLFEPVSGVPISLDDCRELAADQGKPWVDLASEYAVRMLSQVFRLDDPVLELTLAAERRGELEALLEALPLDVFTATDSLGWTYQFWQADEKQRVNDSEVKIGARELAPVTQLFTEDYMVDFLLHNTLGAWWVRKLGPFDAATESEARAQAALPASNGLAAVEWQYLRFVTSDDGKWRPAAGTFDAWPRTAQDITVLDPCMGSGHFLVFALPILARLRMQEERLSAVEAVDLVLQENLFGLELDERCTQIAAFNLALAAWRMGGYRPLPRLNLACSGLNISASEDEWVALAGGDTTRRAEMKALYRAFSIAPLLGSLIDPRAIARSTWADSSGGKAQGALFNRDADSLMSILGEAVENSARSEALHELAVTARGIARAAQILNAEFTLVATNVPYLGRGKQSDDLKEYAERHHGRAKADLATCFIERCLQFCAAGGTSALVAPQSWLFLAAYKHLRKRMLEEAAWSAVARLGARAFEMIGGEVVNVALSVVTRDTPVVGHRFAALDVSEEADASSKAEKLRRMELVCLRQDDQLQNPDSIVQLDSRETVGRLGDVAMVRGGTTSGDSLRFRRCFWEVDTTDARWAFQCGTVNRSEEFGGREFVLLWENGDGELASRTGGLGATIAGREVMGRRGVAISYIGSLTATLYLGEVFENVICVAIPHIADDLPALWAFVTSDEFPAAVRAVNQNLGVSVRYFEKAPMDVGRWRQIAADRYPNGLPTPSSAVPTQWLFREDVRRSEFSLQVAAARVCGYRWPLQQQPLFGCEATEVDTAASFADADGIVPVPSVHREPTAVERIRALLAATTTEEVLRENDLLQFARSESATMGEWVQEEFFSQHCSLFHDLPFIWHVWDGLRDGFSALVNYHNLAGPNGEGRRTLEKLTHTYLGDWIARQRAGVAANEEGAEARLAAAEHLREQLLKIIEGEPPFDIFVRWKPLHEQPIGWEPDINDGVRVNIRPFMKAKPLNASGRNGCILRETPKINWKKDRGKETERPREDYPWFWGWDERTQDFEGERNFDKNRWNDLHYTRARKERARREHAARSGHETR